MVWGGDPTTAWGFDGLRSSVRQALTLGLSGVGIWGSDIGGFFAFFEDELTPELLMRWVQLGAVSGVMRTQANGIAIPDKPRPQVWDADQVDNWRRYSKLRTQLYPYLVAAADAYRRNGLPIMRQLALAYPGDPAAVARDDEFLFGRDLLAAPVLEPGATERRLYLPRGRWVDLWRSAAYRDRDGSLRARAGEAPSRPRARSPCPRRSTSCRCWREPGPLLPLLPAGVDTLSDYPDGSTVGLAERRSALTLLAFPRGRSSAPLYETERIFSRERSHRWSLRIRGDRRRTYRLQASMRTLSGAFAPCRVSVGGEPLGAAHWEYDLKTDVLSTKFSGRKPRLVVSERCE